MNATKPADGMPDAMEDKHIGQKLLWIVVFKCDNAIQKGITIKK